MSKIVTIHRLEDLENDFIIENPDNLNIECTFDEIPKISMIVSIPFDNIEQFVDFVKKSDNNLYRLNSIKVISKNLFKYYYEFHECNNIDIRPMNMDKLSWYSIKFDCIYYDFVRKDTGLKIQKYEPFTIN